MPGGLLIYDEVSTGSIMSLMQLEGLFRPCLLSGTGANAVALMLSAATSPADEEDPLLPLGPKRVFDKDEEMKE